MPAAVPNTLRLRVPSIFPSSACPICTLLTKADEKPPEKPSAEAIAEKQAALDERAAELNQLRAVRAGASGPPSTT